MSVRASADAKRADVSIVVRRADGRVENLGVVTAYYRNPLRRLWFSLRRRLGVRVPERG